MKIYLFLIALFLQYLMAETGSQMKSPVTGAFDFAYESNLSNSIQSFKPEATIDKVLIQIAKSNIMSRRESYIFSCQKDTFDSAYCPAALAPANKFSTYKEATVIEKTSTVIDYEKGNWQEKTSFVRDFLNGTSAPHINTETNYSNGSSNTYTGYVLDYTNKLTRTTQKLKAGLEGVAGNGKGYTGCSSLVGSKGSTSGRNLYIAACTNTGLLAIPNSLTSANSPDGIPACPNTYGTYTSTRDSHTEYQWSDMGFNKTAFFGEYTKSSEYTWNADGTYTLNRAPFCNTDEMGIVTCEESITTTYQTSYGETVSGKYRSSEGYDDSKTFGYYRCYTDTPYENVTEDYCPAGYEDNGANCKKTVNYYFYSYGCPAGFSPQNSGFTTFTKTDPDTSVINDYMLDDAVNSSTPPANNCVQVLNSVAYEYLCTSGYQTVTLGLTSCPAGTSGNCNNPAPPAANCYKDISYKHYTYGCSAGYITDNYGLATCTKSDPDTTRNNSDILDDACNSATPPDGNCRKAYSYKYYEYQCNGMNSFNEPWTATNPGLTSCTKTDTNINTVNTDLETACNSATAPAKDCVSSEYNCGADDGGIFLKDTVEYVNGTSSKQTSSFTNYAQKDTRTLLCPTNYVATSGTEREKGECKQDITYDYYTYSCPTDKNQYGFSYVAQNSGGNCNATTLQQLIDTNNNGIGDSCNTATPPTNNCQRMSYTAIAGINSPVFVDNLWQCSPFTCNSNSKCGYGLCPYGTSPSDKLFQDAAYNPLGAAYNGTCTGAICDYVRNSKISYCVSEGCPVGPEYINKNGNCYKEECPKGTFQSGDKCMSSSY